MDNVKSSSLSELNLSAGTSVRVIPRIEQRYCPEQDGGVVVGEGLQQRRFRRNACGQGHHGSPNNRAIFFSGVSAHHA